MAAGCAPLRMPLVEMATQGMQPMHQCGRIGHRPTELLRVMRNRKEIDRAELVVRARRAEFAVPGEIAEMRHTELTKHDRHADGLGVLGGIGIDRLRARTCRIRLAGSCHRRLDHLARRCGDADVEPQGIERVSVPQGDRVSRLAGQSPYRTKNLAAVFWGSTVGPWSMKSADWNARREFRHPANMVAVIVGGHQVIDLRHAGIGSCVEDPAGVPRRRRVAVAGVDEQRLSGWRDKQRGGRRLPRR